MAFLHTINGPHAGREFELKDGPAVLGRHPDCDVIIETGAVSRYHARVLPKGSQYLIEDLDSRNGTFVNETLIAEPTVLRPGDQVRVCEISLRFETNRPEASAPIPLLEGSAHDGSGHAPTLVEDDENTEAGGTIMSKIDLSLSRGGLHLHVSPEAKLAALLEITHSLGKALSLDEVLPNVLEGLFKIFVQADRGFIVLKSPQGDIVPRWTKLRRESNSDSLRISRTIIRTVMDSAEAVLSADAASDERFDMSQSIADFRIRSMMCAPLIDPDGNAIGALQIDTLDQRQRFQEQDLELLVAVASQAAIAVNTAQLHEQALVQRELERDLELAREVQQGFLPRQAPSVPGYRFFEFYQAANHVGGDYYDYIELPDGRLAVIVADVVGHGIAAAMLMVKLAAHTRYCLAQPITPAEAMTQLNEAFSSDQIDDRFVTMLLTVLDPQKNEVTIVNAGHMNPIVRSDEGTLQEPGDEIAGLPIGVVSAFEYEQCIVPLHEGDLVTIYTDGINEALDSKEQLYGSDRLLKHLTESNADPQVTGTELINDVRRHMGRRMQNDDMCIVCFARTGQ